MEPEGTSLQLALLQALAQELEDELVLVELVGTHIEDEMQQVGHHVVLGTALDDGYRHLGRTEQRARLAELVVGENPELTCEIVSAVKDAVDVPVFAKLTPNVTDIKEIAVAAENGGADGLTLINSLGPGMKIDIVTGHPILSNKFGGMSGPAIKPIAIRCVYDVYDACDIPIIGVGGVRNYEDVVEFLYAGATAVQIGTSIMYEGPDIFGRIAADLDGFLEDSEFDSIEEMVGFAHKD